MTRRLLWPALVLAHLALVLAIPVAPPGLAGAAAERPALIVSAVADPALLPETVPAPVVAEIVATVAAPEITIAEPPQPGAVGDCALTADVEAALQQSAAIPAAVVRIPATARSVANSLLLWDGSWTSAAAIGGPAALVPIQQVVKARILAASAACRSLPITGPRLLVVPDGGGSIVLAFGSGQWRWDQLLA